MKKSNPKACLLVMNIYQKWCLFMCTGVSNCIYIFKCELYIYIYIYVCVCVCVDVYHHHHVATFPYRLSPLAGLQGYIPYPHIAAVCMFELVVLLLLGHMWRSIGVHHL